MSDSTVSNLVQIAPCPKCGGEGRRSESWDIRRRRMKEKIMCRSCGFSMESPAYLGLIYSWNARREREKKNDFDNPVL